MDKKSFFLFFTILVVALCVALPQDASALEGKKSKEYELKQKCRKDYNETIDYCVNVEKPADRRPDDPSEEGYYDSCMRGATATYKKCTDDAKLAVQPKARGKEKKKKELLDRWTF